MANKPSFIKNHFTWVIAAIQSFFTGLMLQTMVQKNKQDFEARLITTDDSFKNKKK